MNALRTFAVGPKASEPLPLAASGRVTVSDAVQIAVADPAPVADPQLDAALRSRTGARPPQDATRLDEARLAFEKMLTYANHVGLYAGQMSRAGQQQGTSPGR
jgi:hypothetical protein